MFPPALRPEFQIVESGDVLPVTLGEMFFNLHGGTGLAGGIVGRRDAVGDSPNERSVYPPRKGRLWKYAVDSKTRNLPDLES